MHPTKRLALANALDQIVLERRQLLSAAVMVQHGKAQVFTHATGQANGPHGPQRAYTLSTNIRFASVSKAVTARALCVLMVEGKITPTTAIVEVLGPAYRHPLYPDDPITIAHLLTHTAGLSDAASYYVDPPDGLSAFVTKNAPQIFTPQRPGTWFSYSNLGFVIAGALLEKVTGNRFDEAIAKLVLDPLSISGRFNWLGMSLQARAASAPACRLTAAGFEPQIDLAPPPDGLHDRHGRPFDLSAYRLGEDISLFSAHAGLRMNMHDALRLASALADGSPAARLQSAPHWHFQPEPPNGDDVEGLFTGYGYGVQRHAPSPWYSGSLVGHFGNAFGFAGAVWHDPDRDLAFAYALNGLPAKPGPSDREHFYGPTERLILAHIDEAFAPR
ncbi:MAG: serine hydrolase domain-containing protein [Caulobacterales bacterium]|jgi:CubicO group peptidase (beta-lactamase class C family)